MEIFKSQVSEDVVKLSMGAELSEDEKRVQGSIEMDIENQSKFIEMVNSLLLDENISNILVDLSQVAYIDSSGLWALFEGHKKASQKNGKMVLLAPNSDVRRVLDITKMSKKIEIFDGESEALASFSKRTV